MCRFFPMQSFLAYLFVPAALLVSIAEAQPVATFSEQLDVNFGRAFSTRGTGPAVGLQTFTLTGTSLPFQTEVAFYTTNQQVASSSLSISNIPLSEPGNRAAAQAVCGGTAAPVAAERIASRRGNHMQHFVTCRGGLSSSYFLVKDFYLPSRQQVEVFPLP